MQRQARQIGPAQARSGPGCCSHGPDPQERACWFHPTATTIAARGDECDNRFLECAGTGKAELHRPPATPNSFPKCLAQSRVVMPRRFIDLILPALAARNPEEVVADGRPAPGPNDEPAARVRVSPAIEIWGRRVAKEYVEERSVGLDVAGTPGVARLGRLPLPARGVNDPGKQGQRGKKPP